MHVVIVGNGVAGVTAAKSVRENNSKANISIYTSENHLYYPRPRLYDILSGETIPQGIYMYSREWYEKNRIKVYLNENVVGIKPANKELLLEKQSKIEYDKLLLANGAHPFKPPIKNVEKKGVFTLRSISDALTIKEYAKKTKKAIVVGGGLLGLEFAVSLKKLGQQVEVVELFPRLLPRQLDQDGAEILKERIEAQDIEVTLDVKTQEILGGKKVSGILTENKGKIYGDLVLISAGVRSNKSLAEEAGITTEKGIVVNKHLQTNIDDIYAAGDVAEFNGRVYGIIPAAVEQGKIAAINMLKQEKQVYNGTIPSNTLKVAGVDLTSMGIVNPEDSIFEEIKKIDREKGIYKKIVLKQDKIVGAILLGDKKGVTALRKLMDQEIDITKYKASLLEEDFDYKKSLYNNF